MNQPRLRKVAAISIILLTAGAFITYFVKNPNIWNEIKHTPPKVFVSIIVLYMVSIFALAGVTMATLRLCKLKLPLAESTLLTMYAAIVNFFGPLQSGPAFRGVYLKKKYDLSLKDYALATSVYYAFWGVISVLLLFSGILKWWIVPIAAVAAIVAYIADHTKRYSSRFKVLDLRGIYWLLAATILQVLIISVIYMIELNSVATGISYSQVLIYTGAANLALFVSITPGAVGFREAFLLFSQRLHHIDTAAIVAANTIDRAMYFVLLLILAAYIFGTHAQKKLKAISG